MIGVRDQNIGYKARSHDPPATTILQGTSRLANNLSGVRFRCGTVYLQNQPHFDSGDGVQPYGTSPKLHKIHARAARATPDVPDSAGKSDHDCIYARLGHHTSSTKLRKPNLSTRSGGSSNLAAGTFSSWPPSRAVARATPGDRQHTVPKLSVACSTK